MHKIVLKHTVRVKTATLVLYTLELIHMLYIFINCLCDIYILLCSLNIYYTFLHMSNKHLDKNKYWSGLPFPSLGELPNTEIEPGSPSL